MIELKAKGNMAHPARLDVDTLIERGYLQEVNRQFFHPLGLALTVMRSDDGTAREVFVADFRDEVDGVVFDTLPSERKAQLVARERELRGRIRQDVLGFVEQPVDVKPRL